MEKLIVGESLSELQKIEKNSIDVIITSPPYNKGAGVAKPTKWRAKSSGRKYQSWVKKIDYDNFDDNLPEEEYQEQQIQIINECHRVLKFGGSLFYSHKNRRQQGKTLSPLEWIFKTNINFYQEIIWDRKCSVDNNQYYFTPSTEKIFWLTRTNKPTLNDKRLCKHEKEIWTINPKRDAKHPAPFPEELVINCLNMVATENCVVLDPYNGSGTTGIVCKKMGFDYIGIDISEKYIELTQQRLDEIIKLDNDW